ncbi:hypothetical protein EXS74_03330 [Candidatus Woesearchaeota archaeon]|nr:hypothetical protein [Candidatus Woesearchaeota archaeon]
MKYIAICPQGMEDITQKEIKELLKISSKVVMPGRVLFDTDAVQKLITKTQSIIKVYAFKQECKNFKDIQTFPVVSPFRVVCSNKGGEDISSQQIEKDVGAEFFAKGNTVDLKNPKTIVFVDVLDDRILVGVDCTPELLSRRKYRIKIHNQSLNACIAYGLVRLSGYCGKKMFVDPFAKDGVIVIEAVLYKKGKIIAYDALFPHVKNVEINATLAHVRKDITISRIEPEWLDTKFQDEEIDFLVTALPFVSKTQRENEVKVLYKDFLSHVSFILHKKGRLVVIAPSLTLFKEMAQNLKIVEERTVSTSNLHYAVIVFKK